MTGGGLNRREGVLYFTAPICSHAGDCDGINRLVTAEEGRRMGDTLTDMAGGCADVCGSKEENHGGRGLNNETRRASFMCCTVMYCVVQHSGAVTVMLPVVSLSSPFLHVPTSILHSEP